MTKSVYHQTMKALFLGLVDANLTLHSEPSYFH